jgi:hypothetical protein
MTVTTNRPRVAAALTFSLLAATAVTSAPLLPPGAYAQEGTGSRLLARHSAELASVAGLGATGDGADTTAVLNAALADCQGRRVVFPTSRSHYAISAPLKVPSDCIVESAGPGLAEIQVPAGSSFPVFDVDGAHTVVIRGFRFTRAPGAPLRGDADGVRIRGPAEDVLVEQCQADGFVHGFRVVGEDGTTPGTARRISFVRCRADNSPTSWGFQIDDANLVLFDDCHATGNWLDGFKMRKRALNVTVRGGSSIGNGVGFLSNPDVYAGDGLDAYAGGDSLLIDGFVAEGNWGSGLTIKTGQLQKTDPEGFGYVRDVQLASVRANRNMGAGLYLTRSDPLDPAEPLVNSVVVTGGQFEGNGALSDWTPETRYNVGARRMNRGLVYQAVTPGASARSGGPAGISRDIVDGTAHWRYVTNASPGLYLEARNVSVQGAMIRDNQGPGVVVADRAMDVELSGLIVTGNGRAAAGSFPGISVAAARRVCVRGGVFNGVDGAAIASDGDHATLSRYQSHPVRVAQGATDIEVIGARGVNHAVSDFPRVEMTTGKAIVSGLSGAGAPTGLIFGSVGSTWIRTDAPTAADVAWAKTSGPPNDPVVGWQRVVDAGRSVADLGDRDIVLSMESARTIIFASGLSANRTVTLPRTASSPGIQFRIVRAATATGRYALRVSDGSRPIKVLVAPGTWCDVQYDGVAWRLTGSGGL